MTGSERRLLAAVGEGQAELVTQTRSRVDVGRWLIQARVWAVCLPGELALCAAGKRPFVQRVPWPDLRASLYNQVTGELVLAPVAGAQVRRLRLPPLPAGRILLHIAKMNTKNREDDRETEHA